MYLCVEYVFFWKLSPELVRHLSERKTFRDQLYSIGRNRVCEKLPFPMSSPGFRPLLPMSLNRKGKELPFQFRKKIQSSIQLKSS